jgi:hypothetical protein
VARRFKQHESATLAESNVETAGDAASKQNLDDRGGKE